MQATPTRHEHETPSTAAIRCPLSGSERWEVVADGVRDYEYGAPGEYRWIRFPESGLIRIEPVPTPEILALAYPPHYHAFVARDSRLAQRLVDTARRSLARRLGRLVPPRGAVLDIGCSTGALLRDLREQVDCELFGVEYVPEAAEQARATGITVWSGDFESLELPPDRMDLAILQHVLEHVLDPLATMKRVHSVLRPGARVVGELPNHDSWDAKLFGRYWGGGHAPRHIWFFTPRTLRRVLESCGFVDVRIRPTPHTGHWALSIQHALRRGRTDCAGLTAGRARYYPFLLLATLPVNLIQMPFLKTGVMHFEARKDGG
jgi:SAM-dependent methyltransferase